MLYLTCSMISGVDLACNGVSYAKDFGICRLCYKVYVYMRMGIVAYCMK